MTALLLAALAFQNPAPATAPVTPRANLTGSFSVKTFGATPDLGVDSTPGFERAIAAAAESIRRAHPAESRPVRAVRVPAGSYRVTRTLWLPDGVDLVGDGWSSQIIMEGLKTHPVVAVGVDDPEVKPEERPDLFGVLDGTAAPRRGARRGLNTAKGLFLSVPHGDLAVGRYDGSSFDYWAKTDVLTLDFALVRDPAKPWPMAAPIAGNGVSCALDRPRPWTLATSDTAENWLVLRYCTDQAGGEHSVSDGTVTFPVPADRVLKISVLVDVKNARFAAWINGAQVRCLSRNGTKPGRRFRHNSDWPLVVGRQGWGTDPLSTSLTLAGLHVEAAERYSVGREGAPQRTTGGGTVTDEFRYFARTPATIGFLPLTDPVNARALTVSNGQGIVGTAYLLRPGQGGGSPNRIADLTVTAGGPGIVVGAVLNLSMERVRVFAGAGPAVGSVPIIISYPVDIVGCWLGSHDAGLQAWTWISSVERCNFIGGREAVRARGGSADIVRAFVAQPTRGVADSAFAFLPGDYGDGTFRIDRAVVNSEDSAFATAVIVVHQPDGPHQPIAVVVRDLMAGNTGPLIGDLRPVVRLFEWPGSRASAEASVERIRSSGCSTVVEAGPGWAVESRAVGQANVKSAQTPLGGNGK